LKEAKKQSKFANGWRKRRKNRFGSIGNSARTDGWMKKENDCFISRKHHKWRGVVAAAGVHLGEFENQSTQFAWRRVKKPTRGEKRQA
jgi:hypothetical protein